MDILPSPPDLSAPLDRHRARVLPEWIDYNGHMNVAFYLYAFDQATETFCREMGCDAAYVRAGELNPRPAAVLARKLAPEEFSRLTAEVARQEFFSLPEQTEFVEGNIVWLLEVYDGMKFHAVVTPFMQRSRPFDAIAAIAGEVTQIRDATGG